MEERKIIKSLLMHWGQNLWYDMWEQKDRPRSEKCLSDRLLLDIGVWNEAVERAKKAGYNQLIIDLADGVVFPSHPELAIRGSWAVEDFRKELERIRAMGFEVIPKLNFSTAHDTWLKDYGKMVSTAKYYEVCRDLIRDTMYIFDRPRFLHLGMDEETWENQRNNYGYVVIRKGEAWWKDFLYLVRCTEDCGMRPWIWSDMGWFSRTWGDNEFSEENDEFIRRCPKSVVQSNWYYNDRCDAEAFAKKKRYPWYKAFLLFERLDKAGFDQVPTGGYYNKDGIDNHNLENLIGYCEENLDRGHLLGYMQTSWQICLSERRGVLMNAIDFGGNAFRAMGS